MKKLSCKNCLYGDVCPSSIVCECYEPVEDDVDEYIENERQKFYWEWHRYTSEYDV